MLSGRTLARAVALGLLLASTPALAQPASTGTPTARKDVPHREGLVLGVAMGVATLSGGRSQTDSEEDVSVGTVAADFQFGGMLTRRIAVLFHLNLARGTDDGAVQYLQAATLIGFRLFTTRVFWLEIAGGTSGYQERDTLFGDTLAERSSTIAFLFGAGIELYQGSRFTIDIRGNFGVASYKNDFSTTYLQGLLGLNWY